jgi:hypothetical protein
MALNKDVLGVALYNARNVFNDKTLEELITQYGSLGGVRLAMAKADAKEIIDHFIAQGVITVTVTTTGTTTAHSGGGTGTIS